MSSKILLEDHGTWAWITVDRVNVKNAIDRDCMLRLRALLGALESRKDLVLLGIKGAGNIFIAGGDVKDLAAIVDVESAMQMSSQMNETLGQLAQLKCLTVAAINGDAYGGGCELALACDVRIMAAGAKLHFKQVLMGLTPGWGGGQRLARLLGPGRSTMLYATAAVLDARQAMDLGVVDYIDEDVKRRVETWGEQMSALSPKAIRNTKQAIFGGQNLSIEKGFELETQLFAECWNSSAHDKAVQAFLDRDSANAADRVKLRSGD